METREIELDRIIISDFNTRKVLDAGTEETSLNDLANSIRERGLVNPITVRARPDSKYDLIAGQRRFLAFRQLRMATIPATVREDLNDTDATIISLVENVHRADMHPIDKARAYQAIYEQYGDFRQVAKETGVTAPTIRRYLNLLNLEPSVQETLTTSEGPTGIGTLAELAKIFPDKEQQPEVLEKIRGFRQDIQLDILKKSSGNLDSIDALAEQAREGAFNLRTCREGLCFEMPEEWKRDVWERLEEAVTGS